MGLWYSPAAQMRHNGQHVRRCGRVRQGWVALILPEQRLLEGHTTFGALVAELVAHGVTTVGVDMPIGAPEYGERRCDVAAKAFLGAKAASLFITPTRAALECDTHAEATAVNRAHGGKGVSAQAFALRTKIREVAETPTALTLIEVHPELTFRLLGEPRYSKKSWAGVRERIAILRACGLDPMGWESTGWAATDDTLDAAAAALSARRYATDQARAFPDDGGGPRIWA